MLDIETDGLNPTVIWVACAINIGTGEERIFTSYAEMRKFINEVLANGGCFVGHNFVSFDGPVLNRLLGVRIPISRMVDTFLLSMLYSPSLTGGHSLESWGTRLGFPKTSFSDWSKLSDDMIAYCLNDCRVNVRMFIRLTERMRSVGCSERSCEIEHKAWSIIQRQRKDGFQLDIPAAHALYAEVRQLEREIRDEIYIQWPPQLCAVASYKKSTKSDGSYTAGFERHRSQFPRLEVNEDGSYTAFDWVEFNLGSPKQRIEKLLELGWKPREFTEKGSPQATRKGNLVPSLEEFLVTNPNKAATLIAEWIAINARGNMIGTWIDQADDKGLIHGNLWLAGSLRYRHDNPNTANIPAVRAVGDDDKQGRAKGTVLRGREGGFTFEARALWTVRDRFERRLVGVDAKGVQLRVLAHHLGNADYADAVVSGDPHEFTRSITQTGTRSANKNFIYAYLLGGGGAKLGQLLGVDASTGKEVSERFTSNFPGLSDLKKRIEGEVARTGRLTLSDGARILVPEPRLALAYLLQGDESRLMKQAMIYVDADVRRLRLDAIKVGDIHDEWQTDILANHVDGFIETCDRSFPKSGRSFDYRVPIECDAKVGLNWAETH